EANPDIPEALCGLIGRLHAKKAVDRPASAKEVADLLAGVSAGSQGHGPTTLSTHAQGPVTSRPARSSRRWLWAAGLVLLIVGLALGEAAGVTNLWGSILRLLPPDGTLVVEVDDPAVSVSIDGEELISGVGAREIRLKPGQYKLQASKDGQVLQQELVRVDRNGRQVVRISKEATRMEAER